MLDLAFLEHWALDHLSQSGTPLALALSRTSYGLYSALLDFDSDSRRRDMRKWDKTLDIFADYKSQHRFNEILVAENIPILLENSHNIHGMYPRDFISKCYPRSAHRRENTSKFRVEKPKESYLTQQPQCIGLISEKESRDYPTEGDSSAFFGRVSYGRNILCAWYLAAGRKKDWKACSFIWRRSRKRSASPDLAISTKQYRWNFSSYSMRQPYVFLASDQAFRANACSVGSWTKVRSGQPGSRGSKEYRDLLSNPKQALDIGKKSVARAPGPAFYKVENRSDVTFIGRKELGEIVLGDSGLVLATKFKKKPMEPRKLHAIQSRYKYHCYQAEVIPIGSLSDASRARTIKRIVKENSGDQIKDIFEFNSELYVVYESRSKSWTCIHQNLGQAGVRGTAEFNKAFPRLPSRMMQRSMCRRRQLTEVQL